MNNEKKAPVRQIKYRAYCLVEEKIFPVTHIDWKNELITVNEGDNTITDTFDMFILMQFTGLLDKNGKEIYEGDKLQTEKLGYAHVVWDDAAFAMKSPGSEAIDWVHSSEYTKSEVIGNIHEESEVNNG